MSSPVIPRLPSRGSTASNSKHEEELINAYEAEEERIINVLSRKLEQLKEEKIQLENALEAESESHVNRLTRELAALRAQQQQMLGTPSSDDGREQGSLGLNNILSGADPRYPSQDTLLEALRRENEALRNKLVDMERDYIKVVRQNDIYREELIDHRRRAGLNVDNLIGLGTDQPLHRRSSSAASSSPTASMISLPSGRPSLAGMPIPRPPSQIHRPGSYAHSAHPAVSSATTTQSSPSSSVPSPNPYPFSPSTSVNSHIAASSSYATQFTTPPSSTSIGGAALAAQVLAGTPLAQPLTYPSVPPPSLSSSLGSPTMMYAPGLRHSRHSSVERGARVAETGSLSRRGSVTVARPSAVPEESGLSSGSPPADVLLTS